MRGFVIALLAACGGSGSDSKEPDAPMADIDAVIEIDAPPMVTCNYTETADATNTSSPNAEVTNLTFASGQGICGMIDNGHYGQLNQNVDTDVYKITVAAQTDMLVHLTGNGLGALTRVIVIVLTPTGTQINLGLYEGDHATNSVSLPAGDYVIAVLGFNGADISAPVPYTIRLVADTPAARCPKNTAAADYTEANDGMAHDGNDMIRFSGSANPTTSLTPSVLDAPEPTQLTLASGTKYRITGSSADVNPNDDYEDRDTFAITTGATTNQLSVRLNWASTTVDFDYRVFPENAVLSVTGGLETASTEDEFQTFAVKPSTTYWLWVGAFDGATGQPAIYDASICAESFTP